MNTEYRTLEEKNKKKKVRRLITVLVPLVVIIALGVAMYIYFMMINEEQQEQSTTESTMQATETTEPPVVQQVTESVVLPLDNYMAAPAVDFKVYSRPEKIRGIYISGPRAGSSSHMKNYIELINDTEINAVVIDVKNDAGNITYKMDLPIVNEAGTVIKYIGDMKGLVSELRANGIYTIARIVTFKDTLIAETRPDFALKSIDGSVWRDKKGDAWLNPYNKEVWDYIVDISKEAANMGFSEIQFDYLRFSTDSRMVNADLGPLAETVSKTEIISQFLKYAYEKLSAEGVYVAADVYGTIIDSKTDADIVGQDYAEMSKHLDYICPMVYPSHYGNGCMGVTYPDLEPYKIVYGAMSASNKTLQKVEDDENVAVVRPWLQAFTASYLEHYQPYEGTQIREQIQAAYDAGLTEWLLWNGSCNYFAAGLEDSNQTQED